MLLEELAKENGGIHSLYSSSNYDTAYFSWTHSRDPEQKVTLYFGRKEPVKSRIDGNYPLPLYHDLEFNNCI